MQLELLLQISIATLTALGTLLLGMGERSMALPLIAMVVSASSVYLTDVSGWLRLNSRVANIAGSTAVVIFVWDFLQRFGSETQLLAVANLLIYLQFVLLYQRKTNSTYWLLALLSLLQVAVATALNFEILFGLLLLVYLVCGLAALGLFYLHRELQRCERSTLVCASPLVISKPTRRWPLAAEQGPAIRADWQHSDTQDVLGWRLVRQMSGLSVVTLGVALTFFFMVPRVSQTSWRNRPGTAQRVAGPSEVVTLGQLGTIIESPEKVMTIRFYKDGKPDQPYLLTEVPLFRGPCLMQYSHGRWLQSQEILHRGPAPVMTSPGPGLVMQEIRLEPIGVESVYCVGPIVGVRGDERTQFLFNEETQQLWRARPGRDPITVRILTPGFANGRQLQFLPNWSDPTVLQSLTEYPLGDLPRLAALAEGIVADIDHEDVISRARAVLNYLHNSGKYRYSLVAPRRNPDIDPIEDFLFEHREGHCEYYASALTLMLRSIGIPARMVLGFNGGEWNSLGEFYLVRQLNAHAWVEAYVGPEHLPAGMRAGDWSAGAWMTLDPTPGSSASPARIGTVAGLPSFRQFIDYTRFLWSSYIMGMDSERQLRTIYAPVLKWLASAWQQISNVETWRALASRLAWRLGTYDSRKARSVVVIVLLVLGLALALRVWRLPLLWLRRAWLAVTGGDWRAAHRAAPIVAFYRRLETVLARYGLSRPASMTQHEFALLAAGHLAQAGLPGYVIAAPLRVADAFYRVRFGGERLDNYELQAVEQALSVLEQASQGQAGRSAAR
jgi:transglutaminase-like putative cysteine protease